MKCEKWVDKNYLEHTRYYYYVSITLLQGKQIKHEHNISSKMMQCDVTTDNPDKYCRV